MRVSGIPYIQGRNAYSDTDGTKYGIAIHNTANDATAEGEASYATRRTDGVSAHFYVDRDSVIQSLDTASRAGHAGSTNGNQHAVAVEITGTNDKPGSWWLANVAWDKLGAVLAQVCRAYGIQVRRANVSEMDANPRVRAFYSHNDMRLAWGGTTHTDPGPNFPWDRLFQAVNAALDGEDNDVGELTGTQGQKFNDMHYTLTGGINNPAGPGSVPFHVWAEWLTTTVKALADAQAEGDAALSAKLLEIDANADARAVVEQQRDAELRQWLAEHASGQLAADEVVQRLAERLAA